MPSRTAPNQAIADLEAVLGEENVRTLLRTFLRDFPVSFEALTTGGSDDRHRLVHSMKSSSRLVGAHELSLRMAGLEARLMQDPAAAISADELAEMGAMFDGVARTLRTFVGD